MYCAQRARIAALLLGLLLIPACNDNSSKATKGGDRLAAVVIADPNAPGKPEPNTEAYDRLVENSYQLTAREPLSTFSADVDTASYANVRRFIFDQEKLPPADSVRVEELINYFRYEYPAPTGDHPVAIAPELVACPWNAKHKLLRIGVQTFKLDPKEMPPRNFVFLIDSSGSMMAENKLGLLKKSLSLLIDQLNERDRVAIVTYAGESRLVLAATPGDQRERIRAAVNSIHAGGSTNGGGGIEMAYEHAAKSFVPNGLNRVILGTDGDFNVGTTSVGALTRLIEEKRKTGVFLTVLGYGYGNLKDANLQQLAHHGNGHFAYVDSEREAHRLFVEQGGALVCVAKDVKFQVEFNPRYVGAYRLVGYESRLLRNEDFNNDKKDAGDLGSGHTVTALYELVPAGESLDLPGVDPLKYQTALKPAEGADNGEWATIKLRYKDPQSETSRLLSVPVQASDLREEPSPDCRFAMAVAEFGLLLRDSPYKGSVTFEQVVEAAKPVRGGDPKRFEFVRLVEAAARMKR